jgi:hypothetical protein
MLEVPLGELNPCSAGLEHHEHRDGMINASREHKGAHTVHFRLSARQGTQRSQDVSFTQHIGTCSSRERCADDRADHEAVDNPNAVRARACQRRSGAVRIPIAPLHRQVGHCRSILAFKPLTGVARSV